MKITASEQDFDKFLEIWSEFFQFFRQEPTKHQTKLAFNALIGHDFEDLENAINDYCVSNSYLDQNPLPKLLERMTSGSNEDLKAQAVRIYGEILHNLGGSDLVIASRRGAFALKKAFGSLARLAKSPDNEYQNSKDQQAYITAFLSAKSQDLENLQFVFRGTANNGSTPNVRFIGNYDKCLELARAYYEPLGYRPSYPLEPATAAKLEQARNEVERRKSEEFIKRMTPQEYDEIIAQIRALCPGIKTPQRRNA